MNLESKKESTVTTSDCDKAVVIGRSVDPKRKAMDMYGSFAQILMMNTNPKFRSSKMVKSCVIKAIDEILNEPKMKFCGEGILDVHYKYWLDVRSFVNAL